MPLSTLSCPSALVCVAAGDPASPTGTGVARPDEVVSVVTFDAGRTWRKAILPAIKAIYRAENADMALVRL